MKKEQIRELMEDNFEEITGIDYEDICDDVGESKVHCEDGRIYFKPKQQFPLVYELSDDHRLEVDEYGTITLFDDDDDSIALADEDSDRDFEQLHEAIKKAEELRD